MRNVKNVVFIPRFFKLKMPTKTENLLSWLESASLSPTRRNTPSTQTTMEALSKNVSLNGPPLRMVSPKALEYSLSAHSSRWQKKLSAPPESSLSSRQPRKLCPPYSFRAPSRFSSHGLFIPFSFSSVKLLLVPQKPI